MDQVFGGLEWQVLAALVVVPVRIGGLFALMAR
jgi:hypothetical protein